MKINRLEITGFGPFKEQQVIDFDQFDNDGLFLINGKTGSGKSSILDALCFALYAQIPRYSGASQQVRSDHCGVGDLTEVVLEFTVAEGKYQVIRSPEYERPKSRGEGTTTEKARAGLSKWNGSAWEGIATQQREVGTTVREIVKLSQDQFLQVILLAQNRFHEFLFADSSERQQLLRTLFHTLRFDQYTVAAKKQADELESRLKLDNERSETVVGILRRHAQNVYEQYSEALAATQYIDTVAAQPVIPETLDPPKLAVPDGAVPDGAGPSRMKFSGIEFNGTDFRGVAVERAVIVDKVGKLVEVRAAQLVRAEGQAAAANSAFNAAQKTHELYEKKTQSTQRLQQLRQQGLEIEQKRKQVKTLGQISYLEPLVKQYDNQLRSVETLVKKYDAALAAWQNLDITDSHGDDTEAAAFDQDKWKIQLAELGGQVARLIEHRELDTQFPTLQLMVKGIAADIDVAAAKVHEAQNAAELLPAKIEQLAATVQSLIVLRDARASRERLVVQLSHRLKAAAGIVTLAAQVSTCSKAKDDADKQRALAARQLADLYERKIAGSASELAQTLQAGEPCLVCGSLEHPHPAPSSEEHVSDEAIASAQAELKRTEELATGKNDLLQEANNALALAQGVMGDATRAELESSFLTARHELEESQRAGEMLPTVSAEYSQAKDDLALSNERINDLKEHQQQLESKYALKQAELKRIERAHEQHRGRFASVSLRLATIQNQKKVLENLLASADELAQQKREFATIEEAVTRGIQQAELESIPQLRALITKLPTQAALATAVTRYDEELRDVTNTLSLPEIMDAPTEPVDLAHAEGQLHGAENVRSSAIAQYERARGLQQEIVEHAGQLDEMERRTEAQKKEFETARELADLLSGNAAGFRRIKLESFVLAAELEEIVQAANLRLHTMSSGRYELMVSDRHAHGRSAVGLGVAVFDLYTGRQRPTHSLSGGESFLASMALALGLAEVVTARSGGIKLNTLFIDEGFGSLDSDTLDQALDVLDELRDGGRTIGVISHVEAMKEQIPAQLTVTTVSQGWSEISQ